MPRPVLKLREPGTRLVYKISEVASLLGIDRKTVYRWIDRGILREIQIPGGKRMIDARSIENLINGKTQTKGSRNDPSLLQRS